MIIICVCCRNHSTSENEIPIDLSSFGLKDLDYFDAVKQFQGITKAAEYSTTNTSITKSIKSISLAFLS